jgi:hypothetical protein
VFHIPTRLDYFAKRLKHVSWELFQGYGLQQGPFYETSEGAKLRDVPLPRVNKSPVEIWIGVGQRMRDVHPDVWVDAVLDESKLTTGKLLVISDVRFPNEAKRIRELGGLLVKITREGAPVKGSDAMIPEDYDWDYVVKNDGTLYALEQRICGIAREYWGSFR